MFINCRFNLNFAFKFHLPSWLPVWSASVAEAVAVSVPALIVIGSRSKLKEWLWDILFIFLFRLHVVCLCYRVRTTNKRSLHTYRPTDESGQLCVAGCNDWVMCFIQCYFFEKFGNWIEYLFAIIATHFLYRKKKTSKNSTHPEMLNTLLVKTFANILDLSQCFWGH